MNINITDVLSMVGATAWLPPTLSYVKGKFIDAKIYGRMVSRYTNMGIFTTSSATKYGLLMLVKLSLLLEHKDFVIKNIRCTIELQDGTLLSSNAMSTRSLVFTINSLTDNKNYRHKLSQDVHKQLINHAAAILKDVPTLGYLYFAFEWPSQTFPDIKTTTFEFENPKRKRLILEIKTTSLREEQLFFDNSIWEVLDLEESKHTYIKASKPA